jgi:hypothetical protein
MNVQVDGTYINDCALDCKDLYWTELHQDRVRWKAYMKSVIYLRVLQKQATFWHEG